MTWSKLAPQICTGPPAETWDQIAHKRDPTIATTGRKHHIVVSDPIYWCTTCGAYGETAPKLLTQPCDKRTKAYGVREQLRCLRTGKHPKTLRSIPPPIQLKYWEELKAAALTVKDRTPAEPRPTPNIEDDGSYFNDAFRRRGIPEASTEAGSAAAAAGPTTTAEQQQTDRPAKKPRASPLHRLHLRQAWNRAEAKGIKRKLVALLHQDMLDDPDLITFWTDDDPAPSEETSPPRLNPPRSPSLKRHAGCSKFAHQFSDGGASKNRFQVDFEGGGLQGQPTPRLTSNPPF